MTSLVSYSQGGEVRFGAVAPGEMIVDLNRAYAAMSRARGQVRPVELADALVPTDAVAFLGLGTPALEAAREAVDFALGLDPTEARRELLITEESSVRLLPPVPNPPKIICVARNYAKHAAEANLQISEIPILFARFAKTLVAPGGEIVRPTVSHELDWEGELAVVIGKGGHRISKEDAFDHVAGYSVFNDVSVRDYQFRVAQYTGGKNFRASGPFGPYLVTADAVADPHALDIRTEINGVVKQDANTDEFIFDIPTLIEHISEFIELEPGDVIPTGTPAGVGFKRNPPEFLVPGDTISVYVEGVGTLTNTVVAEEDLT